jgi:hypothetical protein
MKLHLAVLAFFLPFFATAAPPGAADTAYQLGERLPAGAGKSRPTVQRIFRTIDWDDLIPEDWDPMRVLKGLNLDKLQDSDPRAMKALERMKAEWSAAPVNPKMNGAAIRISGFVVPLENSSGQLREFLLVPYFGACIHVPPPPSNQIIHVVVNKPLEGVRTMDAVWVSGMLETSRSETWMGHSGYRMKAVLVERYRNKP